MARTSAIESTISQDLAVVRPYTPSWFDRLTDLIQRLPGRAWLYYLLAWLVPVAAIVLVKWADGTYSPPYVNLFHIALASSPAYMLAIAPLLDRVARHALATFRPASTLTDQQYNAVEYRLTTMPARPTLVWSVIFLVGGLLLVTGVIVGAYEYSLNDPKIAQLLQTLDLFTSPLSITIDGFIMAASFTLAGVLIYHTYRQLRVIDDLYIRHSHINLFYLRPLYAFSRLTVFTAIALLVQSYVVPAAIPGFLTNPEFLTSPVLVMHIALILQISIIAIVIFIAPLVGIHHLLVEEKEKLLASSARRVEAAIAQFDHRLDSGELNDMTPMKDTLEGLAAKQTFIDNIPTWPWSRETSRLLVTAITLPIILFVIQYVVQRLIDLFVR